MKLAPILDFDYPITKPFPRNWCHGLLAFGVLSTAAFAAVNVFLVGYDVVSITTDDHNFNTTKGGILPWSTDSNLGCEPHQFQLGDTFRTNLSTFSYTIADVQPADFAKPSAIQGGVFYSNNVLNDCDVVRYEIVVKPGDLSITATASIQCPQPLGLRAVTTWTYTNHPVLLGISTSLFPENSLARAITDAMLNISGKFLQFDAEAPDDLGVIAEVYWDIADGAYTTTDGIIHHLSVASNRFETYTAVGNTELNVFSNASNITASEGNLYNLINILYAAVRLDLGHWTADNLNDSLEIFTNTTSFKSVIQPSTLTPNMPPGNNSIAFSQRRHFERHGVRQLYNTTIPGHSYRGCCNSNTLHMQRHEEKSARQFHRQRLICDDIHVPGHMGATRVLPLYDSAKKTRSKYMRSAHFNLKCL
ncbi:hypothetical protein MVEN_01976300 [Mycena venus]|uniref:Uncharacterized protein n=1 Tax=Mycena venus TaxID=2733690 RepID=A0A8H6XEE3_9AGAR|nr:hypothetical protein MVEN_01976300 [Mycena venus]